MRILVLNYEYPPLGGGAGPVCRQLAELYASRGHPTDVVTMHYKGLPKLERLNEVTVRRVSSMRKNAATCETLEMLSYVISALPLVTWRLLRRQYDVLHVHFIVPTGLLAWCATRIIGRPFIITAHGSDVPGFNPDRFTSEHKYMRPLLRTIATKAYRVVSPSRYLKQLMESQLGLPNIQHIPNGINVAHFVPQPKKRRILMTGRLLPRKGFQHVLHALHEIETDYEIHIAGDGPMRAELELLASKLTCKTVFHGWLDHDAPLLKELYETSAIYCLPSERENASIALLEAMLAQMAVITSDAPGCSETVADTGVYVMPGNTAGIRDALRRLLDDESLIADYGIRARQRVLENFDWQKICEEYLILLEPASSSK